MLRSLASFLRTPRNRRRLVLEAVWTVTASRIRFARRGYPDIMEDFGKPVPPGPRDVLPEPHPLSRNVSWAVEKVAARLPFEADCIVRAHAGMHMLERRGIRSRTVVGAYRTDEGKMEIHAMLMDGTRVVTGIEGQAKFKRVASYQKPPQ